MLWIIHWTDANGEDQSIVVEAGSRIVAQAIALMRDIPISVIEQATAIDAARALTPERDTHKHHGTCFGRAVQTRQLACLMLCGLCTIGLLLHAYGILPTFVRPPT